MMDLPKHAFVESTGLVLRYTEEAEAPAEFPQNTVVT